MKLLALFIAFGSICFAAQSPDQIERFVKDADRFALYSIESQEFYVERGDGSVVQVERFHGHRVLGKVEVLSAKDQIAIRDGMLKALQSVKEGYPALCFEPREAVRLFRGGESIDLLLCFHCGTGVAYTEHGEVQFFIGSAGYEELSAILNAHKIVREKVSLRPNQSLEPMARSVTPRACARVAPALAMAHH